MNLIVATNLLKRVQVQIETAQNGRDAVALAKENQYDVILLDSMMPDMNGEETMQAIRKNCPLNVETPIIVLTAHGVKGARVAPATGDASAIALWLGLLLACIGTIVWLLMSSKNKNDSVK